MVIEIICAAKCVADMIGIDFCGCFVYTGQNRFQKNIDDTTQEVRKIRAGTMQDKITIMDTVYGNRCFHR